MLPHDIAVRPYPVGDADGECAGAEGQVGNEVLIQGPELPGVVDAKLPDPGNIELGTASEGEHGSAIVGVEAFMALDGRVVEIDSAGSAQDGRIGPNSVNDGRQLDSGCVGVFPGDGTAVPGDANLDRRPEGAEGDR